MDNELGRLRSKWDVSALENTIPLNFEELPITFVIGLQSVTGMATT
ncbi:MAG: hypothetical protein Q4E67_05070 [Planctomycetia bacterium]|nr:hypothetical protein [Planctomycetia bacterium]